MYLQLVSILTIFATCDATIFCGTMVKTTYNCIFNYKLVFNYICNYNLWLLLVWMKRKMKSVVVSSMTSGIQQKMKMYSYLRLMMWFISDWTPNGVYSTWIMTRNHSCKCKCLDVKKAYMLRPLKLLDLVRFWFFS
jgi:hypothetical protein